MDELFWDNNSGGYYSVDGKDKSILLRMKEDYDGSEPSNVLSLLFTFCVCFLQLISHLEWHSQNSYAAMNLLRLAEMTGQAKWREQAVKIFTFFKEYGQSNFFNMVVVNILTFYLVIHIDNWRQDQLFCRTCSQLLTSTCLHTNKFC
jgi:uncharacterized protein YyaL (SSP411 family)